MYFFVLLCGCTAGSADCGILTTLACDTRQASCFRAQRCGCYGGPNLGHRCCCVMQRTQESNSGNLCRFAAASPHKPARGGGGLLSNGHSAAAPASEPRLLRRNSSATLDVDVDAEATPRFAHTRGLRRSDGALLIEEVLYSGQSNVAHGPA